MNVTVEKITSLELARAAIESTMQAGFEAKCSVDQLGLWEHSPLRALMYKVNMEDIPTYVSVHLVRHAAVGQNHFIKSNREDRVIPTEGSVKTLLGLTKDGLLEVFEYRDGVLYWKVPQRKSGKNIGTIAGTCTSDGRTEINYHRKRALRYRIIFLMHHGWCPPLVDHINNDPGDDRIENLRAATKSQNAQNSVKTAGTKNSDYKGVSKHHTGKFRAGIKIDGIQRQIGSFYTAEEAALAYDKEALRLFGEFAKVNFPDSSRPVDRMTPVNHMMIVNAQHLIDISRKRLCFKASKDTREVWSMVKAAIGEVEPELYKYLVPNCVYRGGFCCEPKPCGNYKVHRYDPDEIFRRLIK